MMITKYISFSCIECKKEITVHISEKFEKLCPDCNLDLYRLDSLVNMSSSKENKIEEVSFKYNVKPIYEHESYSFEELLNIYDFLDKDTMSISIDKYDLKSLFSETKTINLLTLDLKSFNELNIDQLNYSKVAIIIYYNKGTSLFLINALINNFYYKISTNAELLFGLKEEDNLEENQMVELIYV